MQIAKNFTDDEFRCPVCGESLMSPDFIDKLQSGRDVAAVAFHINSGFRCLFHNEAVGGIEDSTHLIGRASDIRAKDSRERYRILKGLFTAGFDRESVAEAIHRGWSNGMRLRSYVYGLERDDVERTHPHLKSWQDMSDDDRKSTYWSADAVMKLLESSGFQRIKVASTYVHVDNDPDKVRDVLWLD